MIPAVGYRLWRVDPADSWTHSQLQSVVSETLWPPRDKLQALCEGRLAARRSSHHRKRNPTTAAVSPDQECSCGIYAYHQIRPMLRQAREQYFWRGGAVLVGGAVLCWGRVVIHPEGIRAQFARPIALCKEPVTDWAEAELIEVARVYGVPLMDLEHLVAYAREFGTSYQPEVSKRSPMRQTLGALRGFRQWLSGPGGPQQSKRSNTG